MYWMKRHVVCKKTIFKKMICVEAVCLQEGIAVLIYGGDKSHIGAVSITDSNTDKNLTSVVFPGHKDHLISDIWARELSLRYNCRVVVSAGIHFDKITRDEIKEVENLSQQMLWEICEKLEEKNWSE